MGADGELGQVLIGPTRVENYILDVETMALYSVDMIRFRLEYSPLAFERLQQALDCWMTEGELTTYTNSGAIGNYRFMWAWRYPSPTAVEPDAKSAVVVGLCHVEGNGSTNAGAGFLEYNPNKVAGQGAELLIHLLGLGVDMEPVRYDLAIDYPIDRDKVRMLKDRRKYEAHIRGAITEYLGQRNKPGRVKVYDKMRESGLSNPMTRIELTVDATWDEAEVMNHFPVVFSYDSVDFDNLRGTTKAFAISIQAHLEKGDILETWLRLCEGHMRSKLKKVFESAGQIKYSADCVHKVMERVSNWSAYCNELAREG